MKLKIATISDVHLGHKRNKTQDIIAALDASFLNHPDLPECDIIFIAGDLFDRLLEPTAPEKPDIYLWFVRLCRFCQINNIVLRILEGTPSHDWKQCEVLPTIKTISTLDLDFKYVKTLSIEYIEKFNINVLYMPDEWRSTPEETFEEVKDLLKSKGLTSVEFGVFHGNFEYQLPQHIKGIPRHSSQEYLNIVSELIFIGHIHTHSRFERIVAQGSFDRLSHGEEEPKGFVIADVDIGKNDRNVYFVENKYAKIYKTINCTGMSLQETIEHVKQVITNLPANSAIRIEAEQDHLVFTNMEAITTLCQTMTWTKKQISPEQIDIEKEYDTSEDMYQAVTLTRDNIQEILLSRAAFKVLDLKMNQAVVRHLQEVL